MVFLHLIRHGESVLDNLTPNGREQVRLASDRWLKGYDQGTVRVFHAPAGRTRTSSEVFTYTTKIPSVECPLLAIAHYHDREKHRAFANMIANSARHIVLIGHDETTRWCDAIVFRCFRKLYKKGPPEVPLGGLLRYTEQGGYELI